MQYVKHEEQMAQEARKTPPAKDGAKEAAPPREEEKQLISRKVNKYGHYDKLQG